MITVELVFATAARQQVHRLTVSQGTRARELVVSVTAQKLIHLDESAGSASNIAIGVYGQLVDDDYLLADGDRLEIYRPLQQDPKELRRQRAKREHSANSSAKQRSGTE